MIRSIYMARALKLARKGFPAALPNPLVGAVLVKGGKIIAEGHHARFGQAHAEVNAIQKAGSKSIGSTLFVTLEPCAHWGKTPPCTEAIQKAGIKNVIAAIRDPNPRVKGGGAEVLRRAGIRTTFGDCAAEAAAMNLPFLSACEENRPYIVLKAAVSIDGKITDFGGASKWITDEQTRKFSRSLRARFDAIAVGVGTVLADNPRLTSDNGRTPLRLVLDPALKTPLTSHVANARIAPTAIATFLSAPYPRLKAFSNKDLEILDVRASKDGGLDLEHLCKLLDYKGVQTLLVEGGAETHARFVEAGLVDEILWFMAPKILGGEGALSSIGGQGLPLSQALSFTAFQSRQVGRSLMIRATRHPEGLFYSELIPV